ncbi:hypothetical protein [Clostridium sp.]
MDAQQFKSLEIEEQVKIINEGESLSAVCREIGISKSISAKLKYNGYVLVDGKYTLNPPNQATEPPKVISSAIISKKIGRPIHKDIRVKLTLEINKEIVKILKKYCVDIEKPMNKYIEELLIKNLK